MDCGATLTAAGCTRSPVGATFSWNCGGQDLSGATLTGCPFPQWSEFGAADLSRADLDGADLPEANFPDADLAGASFVGTDPTGATMFDADVTGAVGDDTTCPAGTNGDANGGTCCGAFISGMSPATGCPNPCSEGRAAGC